MSRRIPATLLAGYLGSGKTTAINHLLRNAGGRRIAVLVNDFGAVNIDADLIRSVEDQTISLTNGCVCCSIEDDLGAALDAQRRRADPPGHILIEASGVAEPERVARHVAGWPGVELNAVWTMADAETVQARARDKFVGRLAGRQIAAADLVFLNKTDLVDAKARGDLRVWLSSRAPGARVEEVAFGAIDPALLDLAPFPRKGASDDEESPGGEPHGPLEAAIWRPAGPVDLRALRGVLTNAPEALHRAKGFVADADTRRPMLVQLAGGRLNLTFADRPAEEARVALIGAFPAGRLAALLARLEQCVAPDEAGPEKENRP